MKRYRFSLESVLRARRAQEEAAKLQLAESNRAVRRAMAALADETERYRNREASLGARSVADFQAERLDGEYAAGRLAAARRAEREAVATAAAAHSGWSDAARRVATLERLDTRRRQEWETEARRREDAATDDIVTARGGRR